MISHQPMKSNNKLKNWCSLCNLVVISSCFLTEKTGICSRYAIHLPDVVSMQLIEPTYGSKFCRRSSPTVAVGFFCRKVWFYGFLGTHFAVTATDFLMPGVHQMKPIKKYKKMFLVKLFGDLTPKGCEEFWEIPEYFREI